jgi:2-oxo-4-hydroxy-4-carboxy-5-ureidoimidazoline decarboxylase
MNTLTGDQVISIAALNAASQHAFVEVLGDIVEHSPWVAERAFPMRPFRSLDDLHAKLVECVRMAPAGDQIALFNRHPELAGREAVAGDMTESSTSEQARLGLDRLPAAQFERLSRLNRAYREKFGFPFIAAVRLHRDLESLLRQFESRLQNDVETEANLTVQQISEIVFGRLCRMFPGETGKVV